MQTNRTKKRRRDPHVGIVIGECAVYLSFILIRA